MNDTTPPTVSGTITVSASASDNVGSVQFTLDGTNLGAELATAPYTISWNTTTAIKWAHTLTAVAHDASGNTSASAPVSITVNNARPVAASVTANGSSVAITVALMESSALPGRLRCIKGHVADDTTPAETCNYSFCSISDDGMRLWVNGQLGTRRRYQTPSRPPSR